MTSFRDGIRSLEVVGEGRREDARALRSRLAVAERQMADHYASVMSIAVDLGQDGFDDAEVYCEVAALRLKQAEAELLKARERLGSDRTAA